VRLGEEEYYEARLVSHTQFGDIHENVPFSRVVIQIPSNPPRGGRKRPEPSERAFAVEVPQQHLGVVCHYTCGFVAQPPGTEGYSHHYRLIAPVIHFRELKRIGWASRELRKINEMGRVHGVMYLPWPKDDPTDDEWRGEAAALLYRPSLVTQEVLDCGACPRIQRLTEMAQQVLSIGLMQIVSANTFDANDPQLNRPDVSDSWC
jgi:hypothetical protein